MRADEINRVCDGAGDAFGTEGQDDPRGGTVVINPAPAIITALSDVWDRINAWLGRSQAEQAQKQDDEVQRMNRELQERVKESNDGTK